MTFAESLAQNGAVRIVDGKKELYNGPAAFLDNARRLQEVVGSAAWSPNNPKLLLLETLDTEGKTTGSKSIGFKFLETSEDMLFLNGSRFYARGCIRGIKAHEHDNLLKLDDEQFYTKYIKAAKDLGFNLVRWHSTVPSEKFLEISDRLGMFNHIEFAPKYSFKDGKKEFALDLGLIEDTVRRLGWHPSVFSFCIGNEIHNTGGLDIVRKAVAIIRTHSQGALALDSCGWGEADRDTTDYLTQHIAYFFPFGKHIDMFDTVDCFDLNGSVKKVEMKGGEKNSKASMAFKRNLHPAKPTIAHETFHYISLPDIAGLKARMNKLGLEHPWWIAEIEKIAGEKGLLEEWETLRAASEQFKKICLKEAMERLRLSPWLHGYQMLQLADCNYYENPNGVLDCFDEPKEVFAGVFREMNRDFVILADFPKKCLPAGTPFTVGLHSSNFGSGLDYVDLKIKVFKGPDLVLEHAFDKVLVRKSGVSEILRLELAVESSAPAECRMELEGFAGGKKVAGNAWDFWVFPPSDTKDILKFLEGENVTDKIDETILKGLDEGKKYLFAFNPELPLEEAGLPLVRDRFKPVIWDRGHQHGGLVRRHPLTEKFPHDGVLDFQFYNLVEAGAKITLDKLPEAVPAIQGIDKAARDRMDSLIFGKGEFQPLYTLRRFGYLFELGVGKGKLLVCAFNLTRENIAANTEAAFFAGLLREYFESDDFKPATTLPPSRFREWLDATKGEVNIEPVMNKYWEEDLHPVETTLWWEKAGVDITKLKES